MRQLFNIACKSRQKLIYFEKVIAAISLLALLVLSLSQVILRNFFELGFSEIDVIARHLVLFVTFMGAALISEGNRHIKIDCVTSVIRDSLKSRIKAPMLFISSVISFIFFWYALQFWLDENQYASTNELLALYMALILPLGFFILGLHFLLLAISHQEEIHN